MFWSDWDCVSVHCHASFAMHHGIAPHGKKRAENVFRTRQRMCAPSALRHLIIGTSLACTVSHRILQTVPVRTAQHVSTHVGTRGRISK